MQTEEGSDDKDIVSNVENSRWQEHFTKLGRAQSWDLRASEKLTDELTLLEGHINDDKELDYPITIREIKAVVKKLKNNKAQSDDLVANEMIKFGAPVMLPAVAKLFNLILQSAVFPSAWNVAYQVPIYKKGDPLDCNNYRGISIASCLGKAFNGILCQRLSNYVEDRGKISSTQAAFRKNYSTIDHIYTLKSIVNKYVLRQKSKLYCCFVDFRKAYDSVWRDGLMLKLRRLGIGGNFYQTIKHMYSTTSSSVKLRTGTTPVFPITVGIKQGDNLSPVLFNLFIDDIGENVADFNSSDCVMLNNTKIPSLIYADDLLLLSKSPIVMQRSLNKLENYCTQWNLKINVDKTKIVVFRPKNTSSKEAFTIANQQINTVDHYTYLGVTFSYNGCFNRAIKDLTTKATRASFKISATLKSRKVLNCALYIKLFDTMVKPVSLYGAQVWSERLLSFYQKDDFGNFDRLAFEQLQNKICKCALRVGKYTSNLASRAEMGRFPLLISIAQASINYWMNILASPDKLVYSAYCEEVNADKTGSKNWVTLIRCILRRCNLERLWHAQRVKNHRQVLQQVRSQLENQFKHTFFKQIEDVNSKNKQSGNKLRTYKLIKKHYKMERYLLIRDMPPHVKRALTSIRISAHNLEIERGRMSQPQPTPVGERCCKHCRNSQSNKIEDEVHFISECPLYRQLRTEMLRSCPDWYRDLSHQDLFCTLFTSTNNDILNQLGIFVCRAMCKRKCILYENKSNTIL